MKKPMTIIGLILGFFLLLVLLLPYLLDLNRYRDQYLPMVERALNRKVEIGDIRLMWFPYIGIRIEEAKIFDGPSIDQASFVKVSAVEMAVKWKPLLERRVEVQSFALHQPIVTLIRKKDGTFNTATLGKPPQKGESAPKPEDSGESALAMLGVEQLRIVEGILRYEDHSQEPFQTYQLDHFQMKTESVRLGDVAKFSIHGTLSPFQLPMTVEGSLGPLQQNLNIPHIEMIVTMGNSSVEAKGHVSEGTVALDITSTHISLNELPINVQFNKPVAVTEVFAHVQAPFAETKQSTSSPKEVSISPFRFNVEMGESIFKFAGKAVGPRIEIHGTAPAIHSADLPISLPLESPVSIRTFDVKAEINGAMVRLMSLTGEVFQGHLQAQGIWDQRSAIPAFHSQGSFEKFHVDEVQKVFKPAAITLNGTGVMNWDVKGSLPPSEFPLLTGLAQLTIVNGQLMGFDLLHRIEQALKLEGLLSTGQGVTSFSKFEGEVEFQEETFPIKTVLLEGHDKDFLMQGSGVVTRDQSIKINGHLRLGGKVSKAIVQQLPVAKVALQQGELDVPFVVKGSVSDPKVRLDFGSIQKRLQKQLGDTVQKILEGDPKDVQEMLKKGKGLLKQFFRK